MKRIIKSRQSLLLILSTAIMFIAISVNASNISNTVSNAEHKQIIQQYIDRIKTLQNQIFFLNEYNLEDSTSNKTIPPTSITLLNTEIENLREEISNYLETIPNISSQNRDAILALNSLNFLKNALYELGVIGDTTNVVDKNLSLENFYLLMRLSSDTLGALENLIARD